jgi:hypothetical protein
VSGTVGSSATATTASLLASVAHGMLISHRTTNVSRHRLLNCKIPHGGLHLVVRVGKKGKPQHLVS